MYYTEKFRFHKMLLRHYSISVMDNTGNIQVYCLLFVFVSVSILVFVHYWGQHLYFREFLFYYFTINFIESYLNCHNNTVCYTVISRGDYSRYYCNVMSTIITTHWRIIIYSTPTHSIKNYIGILATLYNGETRISVPNGRVELSKIDFPFSPFVFFRSRERNSPTRRRFLIEDSAAFFVRHFSARK